MPWRPGEQAIQRALEQPFEDVPEHLIEPLWTWVSNWCLKDNLAAFVAMRRRMAGVDPSRSGTDRRAVVESLRRQVENEPTVLLDVAEVLLERVSHDSLEKLLASANSVYTATSDGIQMRVLPEVKAAVQAAVDGAPGSAGDHLATAWNEAYGRAADPVKAYSEAIKAAESAIAPIVEPNNDKSTLGTEIGAVKSGPSRWSVVTAPADDDAVVRVLGAMQLLWDGQTSRHGGSKPTVPETPEAARAAVHIAATLVQLFVSGGFVKR